MNYKTIGGITGAGVGALAGAAGHGYVNRNRLDEARRLEANRPRLGREQLQSLDALKRRLRREKAMAIMAGAVGGAAIGTGAGHYGWDRNRAQLPPVTGEQAKPKPITTSPVSGKNRSVGDKPIVKDPVASKIQLDFEETDDDWS